MYELDAVYVPRSLIPLRVYLVYVLYVAPVCSLYLRLHANIFPVNAFAIEQKYSS